MPSEDKRAALPTFLVANTWVEFRHSLDDEESFRRLLCGIRGEPPGAAAKDKGSLAGECPYRGLEFFDVQHTDLFFGREAVTQWLVDDIRKTLRPHGMLPRFLAILGASGSGKSSVARAGLYASLKVGAIQGSRDWFFVPPFRPGSNPIESLELALIGAAAQHPAIKAVRGELQGLETRPEALHRAARLLVSDTSPPRRVFLLVDQLEEMFTHCDSASRRQDFIACLLHAAREPDGPVVVAVTMRADFYARVASDEGQGRRASAELAQLMSEQQHLLGPMSDADLRLAIEEPARRAGGDFRPGLVETLVDERGASPAASHSLKTSCEVSGSRGKMGAGSALCLRRSRQDRGRSEAARRGGLRRISRKVTRSCAGSCSSAWFTPAKVRRIRADARPSESFWSCEPRGKRCAS